MSLDTLAAALATSARRLAVRGVLGGLIAGAAAAPAWAIPPAAAASAAPNPPATVPPSASRAEAIYLTLVGEMQVQAGHPGAGYSLLLRAAQAILDPRLFKRAIQVALQARAGDSALEAARAWAQARPSDTEPLRFAVQAQAGLQRWDDAAATAEQLLQRLPEAEQADILHALGQLFGQAKDLPAATRALAPVLQRWASRPATAASAWGVLARLKLSAGQREAAAEALERALAATPASEWVGLMAVEWLSADPPPIPERWLTDWLQRHPAMLRTQLAYARHLLRSERWNEAQTVLQRTVQRTDPPPPAEAWLMLGALQQQNRQLDDAQSSFQTYLDRTAAEPSLNPTGRNQAYYGLAQIAEDRQQYEQASHWLDQVSDEEDPTRLTTRRANVLVKTGRWPEALALVQALPDRPEDRNKSRWLAQARVLREASQLQQAFDRLSQALIELPNDVDLLYEQAAVAEKLGRYAEMEVLLREVLRIDPNHHHAMNFLGYSLAERNVRLDEAKQWIQAALAREPNDPYIIDSMGWVLFRLGQLDEALSLLRKAMDLRPDAEIALHLGEVLWTLNRRDEALGYFRQAQSLQPDHPQLPNVLQRLGVPWP